MTDRPTPDAKATVARFLELFRERRRQEAEALIAADFTFTSPYDDAIDRAAYFARCWPNGDRFAEFAVERMVSEGAGTFITYLVTMPDGRSFRNTEYIVVRDGQLRSVDVYFGASYLRGSFVAKKPESEA